MTFKKKDYYTIVQQAQDAVPGFRVAYEKFIERVAPLTIAKRIRQLKSVQRG